MELLQLLAVMEPVTAGIRVAAQVAAEGIGDQGLRFLAAGLAMGFGALAAPIGIGMLVGKAMEALGRNPEALPAIQTNMILGLAFAEAIGIYALVTAVMIGFVF